jgi:hypothetical protein
MVKLSVNFKLIGLVVLVKIVNRSFLFLIFQVYHFGIEKLANIFSDSSSKGVPSCYQTCDGQQDPNPEQTTAPRYRTLQYRSTQKIDMFRYQK